MDMQSCMLPVRVDQENNYSIQNIQSCAFDLNKLQLESGLPNRCESDVGRRYDAPEAGFWPTLPSPGTELSEDLQNEVLCLKFRVENYQALVHTSLNSIKIITNECGRIQHAIPVLALKLDEMQKIRRCRGEIEHIRRTIQVQPHVTQMECTYDFNSIYRDKDCDLLTESEVLRAQAVQVLERLQMHHNTYIANIKKNSAWLFLPEPEKIEELVDLVYDKKSESAICDLKAVEAVLKIKSTVDRSYINEIEPLYIELLQVMEEFEDCCDSYIVEKREYHLECHPHYHDWLLTQRTIALSELKW